MSECEFECDGGCCCKCNNVTLYRMTGTSRTIWLTSKTGRSLYEWLHNFNHWNVFRISLQSNDKRMCVPCHAIANKLIFHLSSNILGSAHSFALLIPPLKKHLYNAENAFNFDVYLHVKRITSIPNDHVEYSCVCVCTHCSYVPCANVCIWNRYPFKINHIALGSSVLLHNTIAGGSIEIDFLAFSQLRLCVRIYAYELIALILSLKASLVEWISRMVVFAYHLILDEVV